MYHSLNSLSFVSSIIFYLSWPVLIFILPPPCFTRLGNTLNTLLLNVDYFGSKRKRNIVGDKDTCQETLHSHSGCKCGFVTLHFDQNSTFSRFDESLIKSILFVYMRCYELTPGLHMLLRLPQSVAFVLFFFLENWRASFRESMIDYGWELEKGTES